MIDKSKEMLEKSERIYKADKLKLNQMGINHADLEWNMETGHTKAIKNEETQCCFVCDNRINKNVAIRMWYLLPNWKTEKTITEKLRHKLCSQECQDKLEKWFYAYVKEGISHRNIRKIIYNLLWASEMSEISFKEATIHFEQVNKGYICKGCRKQFKLDVPYYNILVRDKKNVHYYSNKLGFLFGKVCSKQCFDFFVLKMT